MAQPFKHPSSGVFYLRRKVPQGLQSALGREYKRSLKTRDPQEAKRLFAQEWARSEETFARAHAQCAGAALMSYRDMKILADRWAKTELDAMERSGDFSCWLVQGLRQQWEQGDVVVEHVPLVTYREALEDEDISTSQREFTMSLVNKVLRAEGIPLPAPTAPQTEQLRQVFQDAWLALSDIALKRMSGDWSATSSLANERITVEARCQGGSAAKKLLQVFDEYAQERLLNDGDTRAVQKSISAYRGFMREFVEICGDVSISEISRDTIREYRSVVARLPSRGAGVRSLSVAQKIALAEVQRLPRAQEATIRNKLRAVSAVFSYAVRMQLAQENPVIASGQGRAAAKAATKRAASARSRNHYTESELLQIFQSPVFRGEWATQKPNFGAAWYWLPLLMYYSGARREELAQLRASDLVLGHEFGPYLNILNREGEADGDRGVKTTASRRDIPLHPHLVELGFLEYAQSLNASGPMFPLLAPDAKGYFGSNFGKHWGRYLRDVVGLDSPASPLHGFRHTFKTICRAAGIPEDVHDAVTGHQGASRVARGYGSMPLSRIATELKTLPRIQLPGSLARQE